MVNIKFNNLHVNEITQSSGVFSGNNKQFGWKATVKENQGFGQVSGKKNSLQDHFNTVYDPDSRQKGK